MAGLHADHWAADCSEGQQAWAEAAGAHTHQPWIRTQSARRLLKTEWRFRIRMGLKDAFLIIMFYFQVSIVFNALQSKVGAIQVMLAFSSEGLIGWVEVFALFDFKFKLCFV